MLTIEEIKNSDCKVELECVDFESYKSRCRNYDSEPIDANNIIVTDINMALERLETNNGVIYFDSPHQAPCSDF